MRKVAARRAKALTFVVRDDVTRSEPEMKSHTYTEERLTTDMRIEQILDLLQNEPLHTVQIADRVGLSAPRTRQLVELMIRQGRLSVTGKLIEGKGRPKRLLQAA
jgi:predicted ArsR family transcriptional regulator